MRLVKFPSSNLQPCYTLSCIHFDQDEPKPFWQRQKKLYTFQILIENNGALNILGELVLFNCIATSGRYCAVFYHMFLCGIGPPWSIQTILSLILQISLIWEERKICDIYNPFFYNFDFLRGLDDCIILSLFGLTSISSIVSQ